MSTTVTVTSPSANQKSFEGRDVIIIDQTKDHSNGNGNGSTSHGVHDDADDDLVGMLAAEDDEGNTEYKRSLVDLSVSRFQHLVTQLKFRLDEGQGEAIYEIGVEDDGTMKGIPAHQMDSSLATLKRMAAELKAEVNEISRRPASHADLCVAEVHIRLVPQGEILLDLRIAVAGNVDSGKSTLIGVLTRGALDNGRGSARSNVFRHLHEAATGRTSSISHQIMGFNAKGECVNSMLGHLHTIQWPDIVKESAKVLTFIDLCGHERYFKTTCTGLSAAPDYTMLMVGSNMGVTRMLREHMGLAVALKIPIFVCVTKVDICPEHILQDTLDNLSRLLKSPGCKKMPLVVKTVADIVMASKNMATVTPIFLLSNVTGEGLGFLHTFLNILPSRRPWHTAALEPAEFMIDDDFFITGVGTVVSGTLLKGQVAVNDTLLLGPDSAGAFISTQVKSIHSKRVPVRKVNAGTSCSFSLKKIKRNQISKGMVLVDPKVNPKAAFEFTAEVLVLHHPTTIQVNYQPLLHVNQTRQTAKILSMDHPLLRSGDRASVRFRFMYRPEYLKVGDRFVFRENRTKGIGIIRQVHAADT